MPCAPAGRDPLMTIATAVATANAISAYRAARRRSMARILSGPPAGARHELASAGGSGVFSEGQSHPGVVQHRTDVGQEPRAQLAVDDPVVERQRQLRHL